MFVNRARRRLAVLLAFALTIALLVVVVPAASVAAQSTLDQAYAALRRIPGLKAQVPNLQLTANATEAAEWAAVGEIVLNKRLRNWFKPLVESKLGWGQLPKAGAPVIATFVLMQERPSLKGSQQVVVHQGYSDGSKVVAQGSETNPFEADQSIDSFGIWFREGSGFYPQAASTSVGPAGPNWYDLRFKGAGGIDKRMLANVVPVPKSGSGGGNPPPGGGGGGGGGAGGGAGGGNPPPGGGAGAGGAGGGDDDGGAADVPAGEPAVHLAIETSDPTDPGSRKFGEPVWHAGVYDLIRTFLPGGDPTTCVSVLGTQAVDTFGVVEINIQSLSPYDVEVLKETVKLYAYDADGNFLGEFEADWTSYANAGSSLGAFVYQGLAELPYTPVPIASVRLATDDTIRSAILASSGDVAADPALAAGQVAMAATPNRVGVPGRDGVIECGTIQSDDVDICSAGIVAAMEAHDSASGADPASAGEAVTGTLATGNKNATECHGAKAGRLAQILSVSGEPSTSEKVEKVAAIPGCPTTKLEELQGDFVAVFCEAFTLYLWLQDAPISGEAADREADRLRMLVSWAHFRAADERGPILDEDNEPMSLGEAVPLAAVREMQEAVDAAASQATWELAVPPGANA